MNNWPTATPPSAGTGRSQAPRRDAGAAAGQLGPDHPDTLTSMNNLAVSYAALGRYPDALKLHEETLALRQAKLGPDHPDTLTSMNNLARQLHRLRPARRRPQARRRDAGAAAEPSSAPTTPTRSRA